MGGVASRLQGGDGARRLDESGEEEVKDIVWLRIVILWIVVILRIRCSVVHDSVSSWEIPWAEEPKEEERLKEEERKKEEQRKKEEEKKREEERKAKEVKLPNPKITDKST